MRIVRNPGLILLAIWLVLMGIVQLGLIAVPTIILGLLALVAGICLLIAWG